MDIIKSSLLPLSLSPYVTIFLRFITYINHCFHYHHYSYQKPLNRVSAFSKHFSITSSCIVILITCNGVVVPKETLTSSCQLLLSCDAANCGAWWLSGKFGVLRSEGRRFESNSSRHVGIWSKSLTYSCL